MPLDVEGICPALNTSSMCAPKVTNNIRTTYQPTGPGEAPVPLEVEGMWPYWLEESGRAPNTVHNSLVAMDSMFLLTGACRCSWCRFSRFLAGLEIVLRSSSSSLNGVRCQRYRLVDVLSSSPLFLCSAHWQCAGVHAATHCQLLQALGADVSLDLKSTLLRSTAAVALLGC